MVERAQVVVIGAGIVGASIAYYLTEAGIADVVVCETGLPCEGSTAKATGGLRHQFSNKANVRLSQTSIPLYRRFEEELGRSINFRAAGYMFVSDDAERGRVLRHAVEMQRELGVDVTLLDRDGVSALVPGLNVAALDAASYCPEDALASPSDACNGYLEAAARRGVRVMRRRTVTGIRTNADRISAVDTDQGTVDCEIAVNAAGVRAPEIGALVGIEIPIEPQHRQAFMTGPVAGMPHELPFTVDLDTGAYFHREGEGLVLGGTDDGDSRGFDERLDWSLLPKLVDAVMERFPVAANAQIKSGWAGLREMTPDGMAIVDRLGSPEGYVIAAGFSGHGFMHAPAVGQLVAALVKGDHPADAAPLSLSRFQENTPFAEERQKF